MRTALALGVVALVAATTVTASPTGASGTSLRVTYWKDDADPAPEAVWILRCNPPRGTLARPAVACRKLAVRGAALFSPVPPDTACTEIYGGPQRARVVGAVAGRRVWATMRRTNGCEIERWDRLAPWLLPRGGVAG
jgi:hypothetical protein